MNKLLAILLFVVVVVATLNPFYIVSETQRAVMLKFGAIDKTDIQPGLHFKVPFVNEVKKFDGRILTLDAEPQGYLTSEKKTLVVDSYAKWQIENVTKYYTATNGDEETAITLLSKQIDDALFREFGQRTLHEVVSEQREELVASIVTQLSQSLRKEFGIRLIDVRVKQIEFPKVVMEQSVYGRMKSERERIATELRSQGKAEAEFIRANADKQKVIMLAQAYKEAEKIRGEGDAKAASVYAQAYNKDPEFYAFTRSLKAYRSSFSSKSDVMVIDSKSAFFKYLKASQ